MTEALNLMSYGWIFLALGFLALGLWGRGCVGIRSRRPRWKDLRLGYRKWKSGLKT